MDGAAAQSRAGKVYTPNQRLLYRSGIEKGSEEPFISNMVNLTTTQVETFFGELEYIEPRLKALGVLDD